MSFAGFCSVAYLVHQLVTCQSKLERLVNLDELFPMIGVRCRPNTLTGRHVRIVSALFGQHFFRSIQFRLFFA